MREASKGPESLLNEVEHVSMATDYARLWFCFPLQAHAGKCHRCNTTDAASVPHSGGEPHLYQVYLIYGSCSVVKFMISLRGVTG